MIWDESVLEKSESLKAERLCAVRSSKARRLKCIKPGFFNPPGGRPVCVPGFHWLKVLVIGHKGPATLAHMRWWTTRGAEANKKREEEGEVFDLIDGLWSKEVIHLWDRGFAGKPWLTQTFLRGARFILRWPKNYQLLDEYEQLKKPGELSKAKRSWDHRLVWDARRRCERKTGIIAFPVFDRTHHQPLWLVVARRKGVSPWYLLTSEPAIPLNSPGKSFSLTLVAGRLKWRCATTNLNSPLKAPDFSNGMLVLNSCPLQGWFILSCSPFSIPLFLNCVPGSCTPFAIVPESGARSLQLRFIVYVSHSLFSGFLAPLPSSPFYEIRDASCFNLWCWLCCSSWRCACTCCRAGCSCRGWASHHDNHIDFVAEELSACSGHTPIALSRAAFTWCGHWYGNIILRARCNGG